MPAGKLNYLVVYPNDAQVYGTASKEIALNSPPPDGWSIEDKRVYFISMEPDAGRLVWRRVSQDEVESAELKYPKKKEVVVDEG